MKLSRNIKPWQIGAPLKMRQLNLREWLPKVTHMGVAKPRAKSCSFHLRCVFHPPQMKGNGMKCRKSMCFGVRQTWISISILLQSTRMSLDLLSNKRPQGGLKEGTLPSYNRLQLQRPSRHYPVGALWPFLTLTYTTESHFSFKAWISIIISSPHHLWVIPPPHRWDSWFSDPLTWLTMRSSETNANQEISRDYSMDTWWTLKTKKLGSPELSRFLRNNHLNKSSSFFFFKSSLCVQQLTRASETTCISEGTWQNFSSPLGEHATGTNTARWSQTDRTGTLTVAQGSTSQSSLSCAEPMCDHKLIHAHKLS